MRYDHRILIGLTAAIGKMGPQSQLLTNRVAYQIGTELGAELKARRKIGDGMGARDLWVVLNQEIDIDSTAQLREEGEGADKRVEIKITACNICPKKVGKYALPATACPVGGIFKGAAEQIGLANPSTSLDLTPGETCHVRVGGSTKTS